MKIETADMCDYCCNLFEKSELIDITIDGRDINTYCRECWDSHIRDVVIKLTDQYEEARKKYATK
ncbi:cell division protein ZapA (FtsZ GTPase activity inhibitor) [Anoxybacillus calidus]|jgi:hypothetical protein|uniref:Cell division protein ZapA (FtsZ GTPase activity inhibitor) n=1 Tax=[Anoxybacillus] calidus TaxID=575178 RepID=A0A7W0BTY3_9BACL|nr:hypothetical protein [Anoxybacillus calidus]MBA2870233.1 cell division protein ZapA (FtsZ GTPase activity inhibitor) [Anoxybacillus calidus]